VFGAIIAAALVAAGLALWAHAPSTTRTAAVSSSATAERGARTGQSAAAGTARHRARAPLVRDQGSSDSNQDLGTSKSDVSSAPAPAAAGTAPAAALGIWTSAEDSGNYSTVSGQHPNIANYYLAWGQEFPTSFIDAAEAAGATPYIELEPWHAGPSWNETPSMVDIGNNTSADCGPNGTSSCEAWLESIGQDVKSFGHDVIFTFAHEFNVSGQYPWSQGDSEGTTPSQWIQAWDTVEADINNNSGSPYAFWMWAPNADTGGSTVPFGPWWPGASEVNMVGIDGYPQTQYNLDTFQEVFGQSFTEMKALTNLPIFISETDLAPETGSGGTQTVTQFVQAALADGASGLLQFQDSTPALSSEQWSELDAALASAPGNGTR
jgi:beta-mannanase